MLFLDDYQGLSPEELRPILSQKVLQAEIPAMVVTMGEQGAVYADSHGDSGCCPARKVHVKDTTGAGDAFCAGVIYAMHQDWELADALKLGSAFSNFNLRSATASGGAVSLEKMTDFLKNCQFTSLPDGMNG